jgi:flagellar basal-body rod protein FlgB
MFLGNSFGRTLDILHRTMDVNLMRQDVIANNIANADTPDFKRGAVNFEAELEDALRSQREQPRFSAARTHQDHIGFHEEIDYRTVTPRRYTDYATTADNNGNNVNIEQESMNLVNNQLMYQMMTNAVGSQISRVNMVLR